MAAPADRRRFLLTRIVIGCSAATVVAASYAYAPFVGGGPVICPMHGLFGLPCPGCGLTRAFCSLARFDIPGALAHHALSPPLFAVVAATPVFCGYEAFRGRARRFHALLHSDQLGWAVGGLLIVHHALRVTIWLWNGTLVDAYVKTSWTWALLRFMNIA